MYRRVWVVQDGESGTFLCPHNGTVGNTYRFKEAGHFLSEDEAFDAAEHFCNEKFDIVDFIIDSEPNRQMAHEVG